MTTLIRIVKNSVRLFLVAVAFAIASSAFAERATVDAQLQKWISKPGKVNLGVTLSANAATNTINVEFGGATYTFYGAGCDVTTNFPTIYASVPMDEPVTFYVWGSKISSISGTVIRPKIEDNKASTIHEPHLSSSPIVVIDKEERYTLGKSNPTGCNYLEQSWELVVKKQPAQPVQIRGKRTAEEAGELTIPGISSGLEMGPSRSEIKEEISLRWNASVGRLSNGRSAGSLVFNGNTATNTLLSLSSIKYDVPLCRSNDLEVLYDIETGDLMQIRAPQAFITLTNIGSNGVSISYFTTNQCSGTTNIDGFYTLVTNAAPFVQWRLQNIGTNQFKLAVTETRKTLGYTNTAEFNTNNACWTLEKGAGAEKITEQRWVYVSNDGLTRRETNIIQNASAVVSKKSVETYHKFAWGWELILVVEDPDGENLETSYAFYDDPADTDNYGNLKWLIQPDGGWERRFYEVGALKYSIKPYRNDPLTPDLASINRGLVTWYVYWTGDQNKGLTLWELNQAVNPTVAWLPATDGVHNQWNHRSWSEDETIETYTEQSGYIETFKKGDSKFTDKAEPWQAGLPYASFQKFGVKKSFAYSYGDWSSTNSTFTTTNQQRWFRQTQINGYDWPNASWNLDVYTNSQPISSFDGVAIDPVLVTKNISTREDSLYFGGVERCRLKYVYNNSNSWELIERMDIDTDFAGNIKKIAKIDVSTLFTNILYEASNIDAEGNLTNGKIWESDENGEITEYAYDSLKRMASKTKLGVASMGMYSVQPNQVVGFYYDALGRVTNEIKTAASITYTNSMLYNSIGRLVMASGINGTTNIQYNIKSRIKQTTFPGGKFTREEYYLDGRLASKTGIGLVPEYYDYRVDNYGGDFGAGFGSTTGHDSLKIFYGKTNSQRWKLTHMIGDSMRTWEYSSSVDPGNPILKYPVYSESGNQIGITDSSENRIFERHEPNNITFSYVGAFKRAKSEETYYEKIGDDWFYSSYVKSYPTEEGATNYVVQGTRKQVTGLGLGVTGQDVKVDALGKEIITFIKTDRDNRLRYEVVKSSGIANANTNVFRNGLKQLEISASVKNPRVWFYDDLNRVVRIEEPTGCALLITYDGFTQRVLTRTDWATNTTTFSYYSTNSINYGLVRSETKANGAITYCEYNDLGKPIKTWGSARFPQESIYNEFGELIQTKTFRTGRGWNEATWPNFEGKADITSWGIDEASGLTTNKVHADGTRYHLSYRFDGKLTEKKWARGVSINYNYNDFSDLLRISYTDGTPAIEFSQYDSIGRPVVIKDGMGTNYINYDKLGNITEHKINGITISNSYSSNFGRTNMVLFLGGSNITAKSYEYDNENGRIRSINFGNYAAVYAYATNTDLISDTVFKENGVTVFATLREYEYGLRLKSISNVGENVGTVSSHTYDYDAVNRRCKAMMADQSFWNYEYDDRDQVIKAKRRWNTNTFVAGQQYEYTYDNIGNRVSLKEGGNASGADLRSVFYRVNAINQYQSIQSRGSINVAGEAITNATVTINNETVSRQGKFYSKELTTANLIHGSWEGITNVAVFNGAGSAGADVIDSKSGHRFIPPVNEVFEYDKDGNLIKDARWNYRWDAENRLILMFTTEEAVASGVPRAKIEFTYDFMMRRSSKTSYSWNATTHDYEFERKTLFAYDGWNLIGKIGVDVANNVVSPVDTFYWGMDLSGNENDGAGVGGLLAFVRQYETTSTAYFAGYDGEGNVTVLISSGSGNVSGYYEYSPYGAVIRASGDIAQENPFQFATKYRDSETECLYYGMRYYSPYLGQWLSRDPIEEEGGLHLRSFVKNNPINSYDIAGLMDVTTTTGAAAEGVGGETTEAGTLLRSKKYAEDVVQAAEDFYEIVDLIFDATGPGSADLLIELFNKRGEIIELAKKGDPTAAYHHIIPQKFRKALDGLINVDKITVGLSELVHRKVHSGKGFGKGGVWNGLWNKFFESKGGVGNASKEDILKFSQQMMEFFGFDVLPKVPYPKK